jgi:hypothetical protein
MPAIRRPPGAAQFLIDPSELCLRLFKAWIVERTIAVVSGEENNQRGVLRQEVLMLSKRSLALAGALAVLPQLVLAAEAGRCVDVAVPKKAVESRNGKWIELTVEQWQFLRGIYAMNPETPAGLPYGDKAALAKVDGHAGGLIFFIDGERACTPMPVPEALLGMMDDVATAKISHEGSGL